MSRKIINLLLITLLTLNLSLTFYLSTRINFPGRQTREACIILIEKGWTPKKIARELKRARIIQDHFAFYLSYSLYFSPHYLKAGEYKFGQPITPKRAMLDMITGKVLLHPLTVPEGLTFKEIADLIEQKKYPLEGSFREACYDTSLVAEIDPVAPNLEGYLFPETYYFSRGVSAKDITRAMVDQFNKNFGKEALQRTRELKMTVREVVTLASLIEKETSLHEEKPLVSAVFHNRLRLGMKLDCDPTIIYALKLENRFDGNLKLEHKKLNSPYNTYLYRGLPPGPICNPGKDSIQAALYPAQVDYLYFVSRNDGSHVFSRSYSEHLKAVRKYQLKNTRHLR